jgi:hypothetical protein
MPFRSRKFKKIDIRFLDLVFKDRPGCHLYYRQRLKSAESVSPRSDKLGTFEFNRQAHDYGGSSAGTEKITDNSIAFGVTLEAVEKQRLPLLFSDQLVKGTHLEMQIHACEATNLSHPFE